MRRFLAATAAAVMVVGLGVAGAAPASADVACPTINPETGKFDPRPAPDLDWSACDVTRGDWRDANATGMTLYRTLWGWSDARRALLRNANMAEVTFLGPVDLTGADLNGVDLTKADLRQAFVVSSGDSGNLGCGIKGDPRLLPNGWAITGPERCLKVNVNNGGSGNAANAAPQACGPVTIPQQNSRLFRAARGPAAVSVRGMTCGEAISFVAEVTQDGNVTARELQKVLPSQVSIPRGDVEVSINPYDADQHEAKVLRIRVLDSDAEASASRIIIRSQRVEVYEDSLENRVLRTELPLCEPADRAGWRNGTCQVPRLAG
jgi:hypothetical protein